MTHDSDAAAGRNLEQSLLRAGVTVGRNVHYVAYNELHLAGLIINVLDSDFHPGVCDLVIFTALQNVAGQQNFGVQFHQHVTRDEQSKRPGTWHFIEPV